MRIAQQREVGNLKLQRKVGLDSFRRRDKTNLDCSEQEIKGHEEQIAKLSAMVLQMQNESESKKQREKEQQSKRSISLPRDVETTNCVGAFV